MINIVEKFEGVGLNGEYISMEISNNGHVYFGTRFEYLARWMNAPVDQCLDFFRNYMCMLEPSEFKVGLNAYRKWKSGIVASGRKDYFWRYFDGLRPQNAGHKWGVIRWI